MTHYRDPLAGLRSQVANKRGLALERKREVTPLLVSLLPAALRRVLVEVEPRALTEAESLEDLSAVDGALDALLAAQDQAIVLSPRLRQLAFDLADPPAPDPPPPWLIEEPPLRRFRAAVEERLRRVAGDDASLVRWGDYGYLARFRRDDTPWIFTVHATIDRDTGDVARFASTLETTMPESVPRLEVRPEGPHHVVGKALGLARDLEVDDARFDASFWIKGHDAVATLLVPRVRRGLLAMADDSPSLVIASGAATLAWSRRSDPGEPWRTLTDVAVATLADLQEAASHA